MIGPASPCATGLIFLSTRLMNQLALSAIIIVSISGQSAAGDRTGATPARPTAAKPSLEERRAAVQRALPYLARQTGAWIEQNKCTSCHQVPHALWAMNDARRGGFAVDDRLAEWNRWSVDFVLRLADGPDAKVEDVRERADEIYQLLLAGSTASAESDAGVDKGSESQRKRLISLLKLGQSEAGSWPAGGRLPDQKRPKQETDESTTLWSLLTLRTAGLDDEGRADTATRARAMLEARSTSTEHLALRYMLARDVGDSAHTSELRKLLLAHQNDDGGWGWLLEEPSDALATGQALYALSHVGQDARGGAVARAQRFLVRTQQSDGSWHVPGTLTELGNKPYVVSNDWGTAWAVIGLMRTIEQ